MCKRYNLTFLTFLLGLTSILCAQKAELIGLIQPDGLPPVDIKLSFTVDPNGLIKGVSITDFYGANQTVSTIKGRYNVEQKLLSFEETENISTYSEADSGAFCFIRVRNLSLDLTRDSSFIEGTFSGLFRDGSFCAEGKLFLRPASFLEGIVGNSEKISKGLDPSAERQDQNDTVNKRGLPPSLTTLSIDKPLKNKDEIKLAWKSDTLILALWDSYEEDGDRVDVFINGKKELSDFKVRERKKSFVFVSEEPMVEIEIVAVAEGSNPPCTVHAHLGDGKNVQSAVVKLRKGESVLLQLLK